MLKNKHELFYDRKIDDSKDINLEKGDFTAIVIAALATLMPTLIVVLVIFALAILLLF